MFIKKWWLFGKNNRRPKQLISFPQYSLSKVCISVKELTLGMYVTELDRPWLETPFLFQGFEIKTEAELKMLRNECDFVYIDVTKGTANKKPVNTGKKIDIPKHQIHIPPPKTLKIFEKEIFRAEKVYGSAQLVVSGMMKNITQGREVDSKLAKEAVADCINSILNSPDAMLWLTQVKNKDEYTAQHSLNVCVLSILLGRYLNYSKKQLHTIGICGLMHDMGKMLVPSDILNKPAKLEQNELVIMQSHTVLGYELLKSSRGIDISAAETAYFHHERMNGTGYPRQIGEENIPYLTRIISIADVYDAITSDKVYQKGETHLKATHILSQHMGSHFDPLLVEKFIECIGLYPPGCIVEMTNGTIAIVLEANETSKLRPKIVTILDENKNPVQETVLDLSRNATDKRGKPYAIKGTVKAEDWNIDLAKYYQQGILKKSFASGKKYL
jgi:HD-GYP domain-containing protein (c-di-GMP phosphodiesterase class II)